MTTEELRELVRLLRMPQCPVDVSKLAADIIEVLAKEAGE